MGPDSKKASVVRLKPAAAIAVVLGLCVLALLWLRQRPSSPTSVQAGPSMQLTSSSFSDGARIPARFTCDGDNISPSLAWSGAPSATKSFALIMHDPDAPIDFTHWLVYNLPSDVHQLVQGASNGAMPRGSSEGMNGFGRVGYGGPCPPAGKPHHYIFHLFALDSNLGLPGGISRQQLESEMKSHVVSEGQITGLYQRGGE
jgi:Raf kinase inhibitor-like YbhB/YbcL family protein